MQQQSAAMSEMAASSQNLADLASDLQASVEHFKV